MKANTFLKKPQTIMELRALIIQACNKITEDMCHRVFNKSQFTLKKLKDVMVVMLNTWFTDDKSPCNGLSLYILCVVSSTVIEIKVSLIDQILDHFLPHPVYAQ
jgi:hypothetical protein